MSFSQLLTSDNPVFGAYAFYSAVLVFKMVAVSVLTARRRKLAGKKPENSGKQSSMKLTDVDPDVEQLRRAHLNDLENIPIFFVTAFLYMLTNPAPALAVNLFRVFTAARIMHTLVYGVWVAPKQARSVSYGLGLLTTVYMAAQVVICFK